MIKELSDYNKACQRLMKTFLKRYYPDTWKHDAYLVSQGDFVKCVPAEAFDFTNVLMVGDDFYDLSRIYEALSLDASYSDLSSYQDYCLKCAYQNKPEKINFKNWVKYPEKRKELTNAASNTRQRIA